MYFTFHDYLKLTVVSDHMNKIRMNSFSVGIKSSVGKIPLFLIHCSLSEETLSRRSRVSESHPLAR